MLDAAIDDDYYCYYLTAKNEITIAPLWLRAMVVFRCYIFFGLHCAMVASLPARLSFDCSDNVVFVVVLAWALIRLCLWGNGCVYAFVRLWNSSIQAECSLCNFVHWRTARHDDDDDEQLERVSNSIKFHLRSHTLSYGGGGCDLKKNNKNETKVYERIWAKRINGYTNHNIVAHSNGGHWTNEVNF